MNYKRHYDLLIERARGRHLDCFRVVADNGKIADWTMIPEDFDYTDDEIVQKFVNPIRSVLV